MNNLTRKEVERLVELRPMADKSPNGLKRKVSEEVFIAEKGEANEKKALNVLKKVQLIYQEAGWLCRGSEDSGAFQDEDGKWYAYRHHARYVV